MKRTLAILLVFAMLFCMVPAFSLVTAAEGGNEPQLGLNAEFYQLEGIAGTADVYRDIIGTNSGDNHRDSFDDTQRYMQSIEQLLKVSKENGRAEGLTGFTPYDTGAGGDGYLLKWTGTITAAESGTYYFVGHKIDNGFVAIVNEKRVYEYWASHHWFDKDGINLYSNLGGFTLEAGKATPVEFWYLEAGGGEALDMGISTSPDSGAMSFQDAGITFNLNAVRYNTNLKTDHKDIWAVLADGVRAEGAKDGNGASAQEAGNHLYALTIADLKARMISIGSTVVPSFESEAFGYGRQFGWRWEDCLIDYTGYVIPTKGGTYEFGTSKVDNCLYVEITDPDTGKTTTTYEFWASNVWNDKEDTYYGKTIDLEAGKVYQIHAVFLEIDGGEAISTVYKINGERFDYNSSGLVFTTEKPSAPVGPVTQSLVSKGSEWYYMTSGEGNATQIRDLAWATDTNVYSKWQTSSNLEEAWGTNDTGSKNQSLWAVLPFEVEDASALDGYKLMSSIEWDDNIRLYINGKLVWIDQGWGSGLKMLAENAADLLVNGTNTIAVKAVQGWGGASYDMDLYATRSAVEGSPITFTEIGSADALLSYVASANERGRDGTKNDLVSITADIDMTGKDWTPLGEYTGKIYGNGHTISNINYTAAVDASSAKEGVRVGLFVTVLSNFDTNAGLYGKITDMTFENCTLTVNATEGTNKEQEVIAGLVAGMVDRGCIENVVVKGCEVKGNASNAGAIAGVGNWNCDQKGYHIENCAVIDSKITAADRAAGVVVFTRFGDSATFGSVRIVNSTFDAPNTSYTYVEKWDTDREPAISSVIVESELALEAGKNYQFYEQTRTGADGTVDYRVICVADLNWLREADRADVTIRFTNGSTEKSTGVLSTSTVFETITAAGDGYTDLYTTAEGTVIFGWVVTGVPADYTVSAAVLATK